MGKIDDMRRLREKQHADRDEKADAKQKSPPKAAAPTDGPAEEMGECSSCGKRKALANGLVTNHQKGFGKMCPGSRKAPA